MIGRRPRLAAMVATSLGGVLVAGVLAVAPGSAAGETTTAAEPAALGWASTSLSRNSGIVGSHGRSVAVAQPGVTPAGADRSSVRISRDGGRTFGPSKDVTGRPLDVTVDAERLWVVSRVPGQVRELVVQSWDLDGGSVVSAARVTAPSAIKEAVLAIDGEDLVLAAGLDGGAVVTVGSADSGRTWATPVAVASSWVVGIDAAVVGDRVVLAYGVRPDDWATEVRTTDDHGATWSGARSLAMDGTLSPSLAVTARGVSLAVVVDRAVTVRTSIDGNEWSGPMSVMPVPSGEIGASIAAYGDAVYATSDGTRIFGTRDGSDWKELVSPAPLRAMFPTLAPDDIDGFVATDDGVGVLNGGVLVRGYRDQHAPSARFTAVPPAITRVPNQVVRFTSSDPDGPGAWVRYECAFGANDFRPCSSPHSLAEWYPHLSDSYQTLRVRAFDAAGRVSPVVTTRWILDQAAPEPPYRTTEQEITTASRHTFRWRGSDADSGIASYDLRWSSTAQTASRMSRAWRSAGGVRGTSVRLGVARGKVTCLQVRARDRAGLASAWSQPDCIARPYDDRSLARSGTTKKVRDKRFYGGSATRLTRKGRLTLRGVEAGSVVHVVYKKSPRMGAGILRPRGNVNYLFGERGTTRFRAAWRFHDNVRRPGPVSVRVSEPGAIIIDGLAVLPRWAR
ncbi:hypothetical protein H4N58_08290 [Mumia sp. ZJ1417]|uniref:hypothetical protein n=1 Tax=Mumia sp. ZJ1417 TaxID=2708082 RepID=UPI0014217FFA|nr:hypothetical protein [Mumia sp. ZJ1417]QMW67839.1 hypothetical protein H4N58_08290 [Mumia sp. ZJ1417]